MDLIENIALKVIPTAFSYLINDFSATLNT